MKIVIYTCLVGNYDSLPQPKVINNNYSYICFTNNLKFSKIGIWDIRPIPFYHENPTRMSRYVKLNPHLVLSEYDYSVYMDANLNIVDNDFYDIIENLVQNSILMASVAHPNRKCIYDEINECIKLARDDYFLLRKTAQFLRRKNYPVNQGLYENNLIFRNHNSEIIKSVSEQWWSLYMKFSKRDQLSLCYVLWLNNFKPVLFFPNGVNTHNSKSVKSVYHTSPIHVYNMKLKFKIYFLYPILKVIFPI